MAEPEVIYEDKDFLAVNKPAGLMVHSVRLGPRVLGLGSRGKKKKTKNPIPYTLYPIPEPTLVDWLLARYPEIKTVGDDPTSRPGIVHRLDRDASGVMLVARNQRTFEYLKSLFQKREIRKTYLAVVPGGTREREGRIDAPIGIVTGSTRRSVRSRKMAKEAVTEYKVMKNFQFPISNFQSISKGSTADDQTFSLLEVRPKTGRTHQIRVHLASIGHPILGDKLYGRGAKRKWRSARKRAIGDGRCALGSEPRLMLHALSLEFVAPDGKKMCFEAEPPEEFKETIEIGSR